MSDLQQDTYTLYTLVFVSVLQGNKRNSNSIHYQHPAPYSRNKMDKHGRKTKTINQNKQEKVGWGWGYNRDIRVFTKQSLQCQRLCLNLNITHEINNQFCFNQN